LQKVGYRELASRERDPRNVLRCGKPVRAILDRLLFTAEPNGLTHEEARHN